MKKLSGDGISEQRKRNVIIGLVSLCILINLGILNVAYPHTLVPAATKARDFSSYYEAAWRFLHNPSQIYHVGSLAGDYPIPPRPADFKYLPSFIFIALPFLALDYEQAIVAFNVFQFLLLPLMALFLYRLLKDRGISVISLLMVIALLEPIPVSVPSQLKLTIFFSSYFDQWVDGNAKVLVTFLILASYCLASTKHPTLSGIILGIALFDPRFVFVGFPLFLYYNAGRVKKATVAFLAASLGLNSIALYSGIGQQFIQMVLAEGWSTPLYGYAWIPLWTIISLTAVNMPALVSYVRGGRRPG